MAKHFDNISTAFATPKPAHDLKFYTGIIHSNETTIDDYANERTIRTGMETDINWKILKKFQWHLCTLERNHSLLRHVCANSQKCLMRLSSRRWWSSHEKMNRRKIAIYEYFHLRWLMVRFLWCCCFDGENMIGSHTETFERSPSPTAVENISSELVLVIFGICTCGPYVVYVFILPSYKTINGRRPSPCHHEFY